MSRDEPSSKGRRKRLAIGPHGLSIKRGRPKPEDAARIEQAIFATAREMFLAKGFEGVAMEGVAAAAGISRTTLYHRYPTKADLFGAVVKDMVARWYERSPHSDVAEVTDLRAVLNVRVANMARLLVDPLFRAFHSLALSHRLRFPELGVILHELGYLNAVSLIARDVKRADGGRGVTLERAETVAEIIINSVYGWFVQHDLVREISAQELEARGSAVIDMLMLSRDLWR